MTVGAIEGGVFACGGSKVRGMKDVFIDMGIFGFEDFERGRGDRCVELKDE